MLAAADQQTRQSSTYVVRWENERETLARIVQCVPTAKWDVVSLFSSFSFRNEQKKFSSFCVASLLSLVHCSRCSPSFCWLFLLLLVLLQHRHRTLATKYSFAMSNAMNTKCVLVYACVNQSNGRSMIFEMVCVWTRERVLLHQFGLLRILHDPSCHLSTHHLVSSISISIIIDDDNFNMIFNYYFSFRIAQVDTLRHWVSVSSHEYD